MTITFLGQGYEPLSENSVGNHLISLLAEKSFHTFTAMSAFASEAGVFGLSGHIESAKQNFKDLILIVGIDQEGTSKEALEEILSLGIDSYIFYQLEAPIFHPKIYLFEGDDKVKIIIGSSNLTGRGLFTNVESSLLVEFDGNDKEGAALLIELKTYYKSLFDFSDANLFRITQAVIDDFNLKGIVPNEITRRKMYNNKSVHLLATPSTNPNAVTIPKRAVAKWSLHFPTKSRAATQTQTIIQPTSVPIAIARQVASNSLPTAIAIVTRTLVWESGALTERDLNVPTGANTNQTGSMLFKKGITIGIDQRIYFRHQVFSNLAWVADTATGTAHIERATAFFQIIILGTDHGVFPLTLSHNTKTNTPTYLQNNSMTSISWGGAKSIIANPALIGRFASLYSNPNQANQFTLEIV